MPQAQWELQVSNEALSASTQRTWTQNENPRSRSQVTGARMVQCSGLGRERTQIPAKKKSGGSYHTAEKSRLFYYEVKWTKMWVCYETIQRGKQTRVFCLEFHASCELKCTLSTAKNLKCSLL